MESKGKLILLLVAGLIVAFAAIAIYNRIASPEVKPLVDAPKISNRVIVAKRELAPGTFVQAGTDLAWQEFKPEDIKEIYLREGNVRMDDFNGAVLRKQARPGDIITSSGITRAGEGGFLSAVLEPGMRAVSIAVNSTSGTAGFVSPGDRVDLIVTRKVTSKEGDSVVSETFIQDVRVVAIDQMLDNPDNKAILAKTVTVEVTPTQVEQVAVAEEMGKISLSLRSLSSPVAADGQPAPSNETGMPQSTVDNAYRYMRVIRGGETEMIEMH